MKDKVRYRGRAAQTVIYFRKLLRMCVYQNDWKVLPMAALIAGIVTYAVGGNLFKTQEGTLMGCFALVCVCIWNGYFNSIQAVCRERPIIKREHRSGMHISSYVVSHMLYQAILCLLQTLIMIWILRLARVAFPAEGLISGKFVIDFGISMFLATYAADMMALAVSSLVRSTTTAMTVMPFLLIFQLVFSGGLFTLHGFASKLTNLTIAKWGLTNLCTLSNYNDQPMVSLWNSLWKFRSMEVDGTRPVEMITDYIVENNMKDQLLKEAGAYNMNAAYEFTAENILSCWGVLLLFIILFAVLSVVLLEFIDRDKR